uniref:ADP ribosylation factor like GTPase 14 n=1 Tax=Anas platyrhynchos TaxID=8839 RepID=A0A8B9SQJ5_ANAPL
MGLQSTKHCKVKQANILMLGLDSAGKSTLLYKFKDFTLTIWDVGGQQKMRQLWCNFLENTEGILYVVDSSDKQRLEESKKEFELILKNESIKNHCCDRNWYVQPCCAITGEGLKILNEISIEIYWFTVE